jgi:hypothetical protein
MAGRKKKACYLHATAEHTYIPARLLPLLFGRGREVQSNLEEEGANAFCGFRHHGMECLTQPSSRLASPRLEQLSI